MMVCSCLALWGLTELIRRPRHTHTHTHTQTHTHTHTHGGGGGGEKKRPIRDKEHTLELQTRKKNAYAVFGLKKKNPN